MAEEPEMTPGEAEFAVLGRDSFREIQRQHGVLQSNEPLVQVLTAVPLATFVFNSHRQLLFANPAALTMLGQGDLDDSMGLRMGEILGCEHTVGSVGGCGTDEACEDCRSTLAIREALHGRRSEQRATFALRREHGTVVESYLVRTSPLLVEAKPWALVMVEAG